MLTTGYKLVGDFFGHYFVCLIGHLVARELGLWLEGCQFNSKSQQVTIDVQLNKAYNP